jgi:hypothetical protein
MIHAGKIEELKSDSGEWIFVDIGFAQRSRSCGFLLGNGNPVEMTFSDLGGIPSLTGSEKILTVGLSRAKLIWD